MPRKPLENGCWLLAAGRCVRGEGGGERPRPQVASGTDGSGADGWPRGQQDERRGAGVRTGGLAGGRAGGRPARQRVWGAPAPLCGLSESPLCLDSSVHTTAAGRRPPAHPLVARFPPTPSSQGPFTTTGATEPRPSLHPAPHSPAGLGIFPASLRDLRIHTRGDPSTQWS